MRYRDLGIETQRETPSHLRTPGLAFLVRAGYITRNNGPTLLGRQALSRLQELAESGTDFFAELGLSVVQTETHQSFFAISSGKVEVLQCPSCHTAAPREIARFQKTAPPAEAALPLEKISTPNCNTIDSLAGFLHLSKEKTAKALMYTRMSDGKFVFITVRGDMQLSEAKLKKLVGDVRPATAEEISNSGAAAGYASPIGLRDVLIVVDDLIPESANLVAGANQAGYHWRNTNYGRDYSADLVADVALASPGDACPVCGQVLASFNAELLSDEAGHCFENILAALAEVHHDEKGLLLPASVAPFRVYLMQLPGKESDTRAVAEELYSSLEQSGISVLFDDRAERAGVKFNDSDLIGCPIRLTVGERNLKDGMVELKPRRSTESQLVRLGNVITTIKNLSP